jgi:hypothetical protein
MLVTLPKNINEKKCWQHMRKMLAKKCWQHLMLTKNVSNTPEKYWKNIGNTSENGWLKNIATFPKNVDWKISKNVEERNVGKCFI